MEDIIGNYLVKLSSRQINEDESAEAARLLRIIGDFERTSDHCSNIAGCIIETSHHNLNLHEGLRVIKSESEDFKRKFSFYSDKYTI